VKARGAIDGEGESGAGGAGENCIFVEMLLMITGGTDDIRCGVLRDMKINCIVCSTMITR